MFALPKLIHAGLAFNKIQSLPPAEILASSPVLSLVRARPDGLTSTPSSENTQQQQHHTSPPFAQPSRSTPDSPLQNPSQDLSNNDLLDLAAVMASCAALPKLRSLSLKGNPLAVTIGYRAYVADMLPNLKFLDGIAVVRRERDREIDPRGAVDRMAASPNSAEIALLWGASMMCVCLL